MKPAQIVENNFTDVPFTLDNLDRYVIRTAILNCLNQYIPQFHGALLDMGCGKMPYRQLISENSSITEYVGLDIESAIEYDEQVKPDYTWDGVKMPFNDESFQCVIATEVLEHCPFPDITLNEAWRVLKPGGLFFFTTPFFWNLHEIPHDEYRFTPYSLARHLKNSGFSEIEIKASGGWHTSLAQMLGLWVRRSKLPPTKRKYLSMIIKPIMKKLLRLDAGRKIDFNKDSMVTTLYGTARK